MIEPILGLPDGVVGVRVTRDVRRRRLQPRRRAGDRASRGDSTTNLGSCSTFRRSSTGSAKVRGTTVTEEAQHLTFHKGAVVTDIGMIRTTVNVLKWAMHGHVRTFRNDEFDAAVAWVTD